MSWPNSSIQRSAFSSQPSAFSIQQSQSAGPHIPSIAEERSRACFILLAEPHVLTNTVLQIWSYSFLRARCVLCGGNLLADCWRL